MSYNPSHNMQPCGRPPQHPLTFGELDYTAKQINELLSLIPFKADRAEVPEMEKLSDVNYLGHVADATLLPEQEQPSWALVGNIEAARPYFFYVEDFVPKGYQPGWNDLSQALGTYNLTALNDVYHTKLLYRFGSYEQIDGADVTEQDVQEITRIINAVQNNKTVSFFYEPDAVTFNYFGTLDCYYNSSRTEFGCYLPTSDGYVIARCNISKPDKWALVLSSCDNEVSKSKNYNSLKGRPAINGVTLSGNHKPSELDLATLTEFNTLKKNVTEVSSDAQQKAEYAVETSDEARSLSVSAESKSDTAVATSNEAKRISEIARNAVSTLEGLANATTAAETLAGQIVQIEENKQNIASNKADADAKLSELGREVRNIFTINGAISPVNGTVIPDTTFVCTPFIKISGKREIDLCAYDGGSHSVYCLVNYYDSDYTHISSIKYNEGNAAFIEKVILSNEIPEDAVFFRATSTPGAVSSNKTYIKGVVISSAENISNIYESVLSLNIDVKSLKESDKHSIKKEDISQSVGSSESSPMSQKIVTDLIPTNKLFSEIGLLLSDGTININQTSWRVTPYIYVEEKEVFVQGYSGGKVYANYPLLCAYDKDYKLLASYGNEAETDGVLNLRIELPSNTQYIRVSARERNLNESFVVLDYYNKIVTNTGKQQSIDNIVLRGLSTRHYANKEGFVFNLNGYIANASYKSSELIKVKAGDILELTTNSYTEELVIWGLETRSFSTGKTLVNKPINGQANRYPIIVPDGVNYICFNCRIGYDGYVDVYSECAKIVEELDNNQYEIENVLIYVGSYIIQPSTGKATILEGAGTSMFIPVKEGDVYYYSGRATAYNLGVAGYSIVDGNVSLVSKIIYNAKDAIIQQEECFDVEFTIPNGVDYIACSTRNQDTFPLSLKKKVKKVEEICISDILLSYDKIAGCAINSTTGAQYIASGAESTNYIPVEEGDLIKVYGWFGSQSGFVGYDENKSFKISIADNTYRDSLHYIIKEAKGNIIKIPQGVRYIRVSTIDRDNYPVEVRKIVSVKEIVENSYNYNSQLKYVWFGDSISQLGSLPHQTCKKMGVDVVDVSFAGAPLTYSTDKYQNTGFMGLVDCIVNNDFTPTETALQLQEEGGTDISHKIVNLNNLKSVNWASVTHIVVLAGTNDLSFSASTIERIKEGLSSAISKLVAKYPHLTLYFVSPPFRGNIQGVQGLNLLDINKAIEEVCKDFNFPFFDFFHNCGVNSVNKGYYMDAQELHPNIEGERLWSTKLANWLQSL